MNKQTNIKSILKKTATHWPESYQSISPEILRVHRISHFLKLNLAQTLIKYDLQPAAFSVLETLRKEGKPYRLTPTQLSNTMLFSSGGLTKVLNRLIDLELISRLDNPDDNRGKLVELTCQGEALISKVIVDLHEKEQKKMNMLSVSEKKQLNQLLEKVLDRFE